MKYNFNIVGTLPYTCSLKLGFWDSAGSALLSGGASLIGGIFGSTSQSSANKENIALQREALHQQREMFDAANIFTANENTRAMNFNKLEAEKSRKFNQYEASRQMDFQEEMSDKLLEYESAKRQIARALEAGINPALIAGNLQSAPFGVPSGASGSSSPASISGVSSAGVPSITPARVEPVNPLEGVLENAADAYNKVESARKMNEERKGIITDNEFKRVEKELNLDLTRSEIKKNAAAVRLADADANLANEKIAEVQQNISNLKSQESNVKKEGELLDIEKIFKSKAYNEQLRDLMAKAELSEKTADAYMKVVYSEIAKNMGAADAAHASAAASRAMASLAPFERDKLQAEKDFIRTQNSHAKIKRYLDWKYGGRERRQALKIGEQNLKVAEQQEKQLKWQNNGFVRGVSLFKDVAVGAASVVGTVYGVGAIGRAASSVGAAKVVGPTIYTGSQPLP